MNLKPYFKQYEVLLKTADDIFKKVKDEYPGEVTCKQGCADCCYALFDVTLIEALYIKHHFEKCFDGVEREKRVEGASRIDRQLYKLKRKANKDLEAGKEEADILQELAGKKVQCPLLNAQNRCDLYEYRPITCRLYGIPTSIAGEGHTCGLSGFLKGKAYPTVKLDILQNKLFNLSAELVASIQSRYSRMGEMLIPLSMALLTEYDDVYLGVKGAEDTQDGTKTEKK
ncbi:YkgJ family cysteine cluster protein [Thermodesulfobacteriota bacterium]